MSLTAIIVINVALDLAIISALAFVMSRAARLAPGPAVGHSATPRTRRSAAVARAPRHGQAPVRAGAAVD